jgi:hypothetical protein
VPADSDHRISTSGWFIRLDQAAGGLALDLGLYALSALFALYTAVATTLPAHRPWGLVACIGYLVASLVVLAQLAVRRLGGLPGRWVLTIATWGMTAILPLLVEAAMRAAEGSGWAQEEVVVVERGGDRLLHTGTPYLSHGAIAALPGHERLLGYLPYQPGMALFGLPRAAFGMSWWTDARVWFALVTALVLGLAARQLPRTPRLLRAVQAATVLPICALTLAVGGDDLPVLALCLLALAYAARDRDRAAGVAIGIAGALKLFAWPVAVVLLALAVHRRAAGYARPAGPPVPSWALTYHRYAVDYAAAAGGIPILALLPAILVDPGAVVENMVRFPLGQGLVGSPAASPFPGHLIASSMPAGAAITGALLAAAGLALGVWLLRRPPTDAPAAAKICAIGMLTAILLLPATRFGYLLYPVAYAVWSAALPRPASPE